VLEVKPFPGSHCADEMAVMIDLMCKEWGLDQKNDLVCIVTDNEATNNLLADKLETDWHGCVDHRLELVTKVVGDSHIFGALDIRLLVVL
jgi:hypothetical protein